MSKLSRWFPTRLAAVAAMVVIPAPALAQAKALPHDSTARVERLADGVYAIIHDDGGVLVVDVPWIEVLRELEKVPVAALVPGHGPVMRDHTYTRQVRGLLQAVTSRVSAMARQGKPVEQIQDSLILGDIRRKVPAWTGASLDADWDYIVRTVIERAWRGVRGQG